MLERVVTSLEITLHGAEAPGTTGVPGLLSSGIELGIRLVDLAWEGPRVQKRYAARVASAEGPRARREKQTILQALVKNAVFGVPT